MSDQGKPIFGDAPTEREILAQQGASLMVRGAIYGAVVFFGLIIVILLIKLVGSWLPPESKEMPDPNINWRSAIEAPVTHETV